MPRNSTDEETYKMLASIKNSLEALNRNLAESLRKLEEGIIRISALGEVHIKLAVTLMDVLGIPEETRPALEFPPAPIGAVISAERSESVVSGYLRTIVKSLTKPCGEIAGALTATKEQINKTIGNFDTYEMEILAKQLKKDPNRLLDADERVAYRGKIRKWHQQLKEAFEKA